MSKILIMTAGLIVGLSTGAAAQNAGPSQAEQHATSKPAPDPNQIICERQQEIGSRIASARVCKTRSEWAEERRTNRMAIDKAQIQLDLSHPQ